MMLHFDQIDLDAEQRELFMHMAEAFRDAPRTRRRFMLSRSLAGASLHGPGEPVKDVAPNDLDVLARYGLLMTTYGSRGTPNYDVSPDGLRYYRYLRERQNEPVEQVEEAVRGLVDASWFIAKFPLAHTKWSTAVELLWSDDADEQLSNIGHLAREALQEFAQALAATHGLLEQVPNDKQKTIARVRAVLEQCGVKGTRARLLDALLTYFGELTDLVQRQEHAGQKEGEPVVWEDARRVVCQTMSVMYEVARAVERKG